MIAKVIDDTHVIVRADGEIDLSNIGEFQKALDEAIGKSPTGFIVDLSDVTYIDSAGVQAIFGVYLKIYESDGRLALVVGNPKIRTVLRVVHLEQLSNMCILEDLDSARQRLFS